MTSNALSFPHKVSELTVARRHQALTLRQVEILYWVQEGKTAWEIGRILDLSARSVDGHLRRIYARLNVRTRLQAVLHAQDLGLLVRPSARSPEPRYLSSGSSSGS
ncbi:response regulator transcription factor [Phenylobacterium sp.]|uniref:response regulator transcription factor n=1 Tax=Phenylobacterium sp. TaxID=1871053 RepID=UPI003563959D